VAARPGQAAHAGAGHDLMRVGRQFVQREEVRLFSALAAERELAVEVDRNSATEVGQGEVGRAVATVRRTEQREERLVLIDRQELAVAHGPSAGRKVEAEEPDLTEKRLAHVTRRLTGSRKCPP